MRIFGIKDLTKAYGNDKINQYGKYARIMVCARCRIAAVGAELIYAEETNQEEFYNGKRNFNETAFGSRRSLRTPDKKMES